MKIIRNPEQFKEYYPYKSPPNPEPCPAKEKYPKKYPCVCEVEDHGGGIGGGYMTVKTWYCPNGYDFGSFAEGLRVGRSEKWE